MLFRKFVKVSPKSTDEEPNECEVTILHQLSKSKPDAPHAPFVFTVAFKTISSSISSKTTLSFGCFRPCSKDSVLILCTNF